MPETRRRRRPGNVDCWTVKVQHRWNAPIPAPDGGSVRVADNTARPGRLMWMDMNLWKEQVKQRAEDDGLARARPRVLEALLTAYAAGPLDAPVPAGSTFGTVERGGCHVHLDDRVYERAGTRWKKQQEQDRRGGTTRGSGCCVRCCCGSTPRGVSSCGSPRLPPGTQGAWRHERSSGGRACHDRTPSAHSAWVSGTRKASTATSSSNAWPHLATSSAHSCRSGAVARRAA